MRCALVTGVQTCALPISKGDVRTYLNGMLFKATDAKLECVASDGHRLAVGEVALPERVAKNLSVIVPRKGAAEIVSLLPQDDEIGRASCRERVCQYV